MLGVKAKTCKAKDLTFKVKAKDFYIMHNCERLMIDLQQKIPSQPEQLVSN